DPRREARLVEEHPLELVVVEQMRMQPLGRHDARETERSGEAREVNRRHAARSDLVEDRVATHLLLRRFLRRRWNHSTSSERKAPIFKVNRAFSTCRTTCERCGALL